jgi:nucleoid-associated protein YgaU
MPEEKKGLFDGLINAVTGRDEKAAAEAAKKEAEEAHARAAQEAEAKAVEAAAIAKAEAEAKAAEAAAKAKAEAAAEADQLRQELEAERAARREQAQAKASTYVVKSGDSLSKIAKEILGDAKRWPEIFEANKDKIKDPNLIHPGQELRIP